MDYITGPCTNPPNLEEVLKQDRGKQKDKDKYIELKVEIEIDCHIH